jgi:hypothetical protein
LTGHGTDPGDTTTALMHMLAEPAHLLAAVLRPYASTCVAINGHTRSSWRELISATMTHCPLRTALWRLGLADRTDGGDARRTPHHDSPDGDTQGYADRRHANSPKPRLPRSASTMARSSPIYRLPADDETPANVSTGVWVTVSHNHAIGGWTRTRNRGVLNVMIFDCPDSFWCRKGP